MSPPVNSVWVWAAGASLSMTLRRAVEAGASGCAAARAGPLRGKGVTLGRGPYTSLLGKAGWWVRGMFCRCIPSVCLPHLTLREGLGAPLQGRAALLSAVTRC